MPNEIRLALRARRIELGWGQHKTAVLAGCTYQMIMHVEAGRRVPSLQLLDRLTTALGLTVKVEKP